MQALSELNDFNLHHELIGKHSQIKKDRYLQATYQTSLPGIFYRRKIYLNSIDKPEELLLVTNPHQNLQVKSSLN